MPKQDQQQIDERVLELLEREGALDATAIRERLGFGDVMPTPVGSSLVRLVRQGSIVYLGEKEGWAIRKKKRV